MGSARAQKFNDTSRFFGNIFEDNAEFRNILRNIYPEEREMKVKHR